MRNLLCRMAQRARPPHAVEDGGFSLVEMIVAMGIATSVFLAMAVATMSSVRGSLVARQNQSSLDVINQAIETVRALDYGAVTMVSSDLAGDSNVSAGPGGTHLFNPGTGSETIVEANVGSINPHVTIVNGSNGTVYTVKRYVTAPTDTTGASYRRLTVVATWVAQRQTHSRKATTFLVDTRRGLPLPRFVLAANPTAVQVKGPGTQLDWGLKLQNLGARDSWNVAASTGTWAYYLDDNHDGVHQSTETTLLGDADGDGRRDTPMLDNLEIYYAVATRTIGTNETGTVTVTFTATSIAQPAAASASKSVATTLTITGTPASCSGSCTISTYYLRNPAGATQTTTSAMLMDTLASASHSIPDNYSTEQSGTSPGRVLVPGGSGATESPGLKAAYWRYQMASKQILSGTATLTLYLACPTSPGPVGLTVYLGAEKNGTFTAATSAAISIASCSTSSFVPVLVSIPASDTINNNEWLGVKVIETSGPTLRLMYDYSGTLAKIEVPQK